MLYARLTSGYRPGGPNPNAALLRLPSQYEPDKTRNYEMGFKGAFFEHTLSIDTSLYYIDWKDIQIPLSQNGFSYYSNGSRAQSRGLELSAEVKPISSVTISGWITWADAKLTEALPLNSAKLGSSGNLSLQQTFSLTNQLTGFAGATIAYVGYRQGSFQPTAVRQFFPAYAKLDLRLGAQSNRWSGNLFVTNLADRRGLLGGGLDTIPTTSLNIIQPQTMGMSLSRTF